MSRNYVFAPGEYYHLYARGFEKLPVFRDVADYNRFVLSLYVCNSSTPVHVSKLKRDSQRTKSVSQGLTLTEIEKGEEIVNIGAYCLMPNHFHILVREKEEGGISKFMQKLMTSYTMYFNKKNDRTGAIFGSSFKARHVTDDNHLKYLFAYIHMNPLEIIEKGALEKYRYSSYSDYLKTNRSERVILQKDEFPDYFEGAMENEIAEWLSFSELSETVKV